MKKFIILILTWFVTLPITLNVCYAQDLELKVPVENLRKEPNGEKIGTLSKGAEFFKIDEQGEWIKVRLEGWVWGPSIKFKEELKELTSGKISGYVYITLGSGASNILRGLEVYLIKDTSSFAGKIEKVMEYENKISNVIENALQEVQQNSSSSMSFNNITVNMGKLSSCMGFMKRYEILSNAFFSKSGDYIARTSYEGKFEFRDLHQGKYYIYARYKTALDTGYWLVETEIKQEKPILETDLSNYNLVNLNSKMKADLIETHQQGQYEFAQAMGCGNLGILELKKQSLQFENSIVNGERYSEVFVDFPVSK